MKIITQRQELAQIMATDARAFHQQGWLPGTSGNFSIRLEDYDAFIVSASGKDKGQLSSEDFLVCDRDGIPLEESEQRPSAETKIHSAIYRTLPHAGAVYHVHQIHAALCSHRDWPKQHTRFENVEMIKGLNIWKDNCAIKVPIIENFFDLEVLAHEIQDYLESDAFDHRVPGVNIRNHGIYAWGANAFEAKRHVESFGYLFQYSWEVFRAGL